MGLKYLQRTKIQKVWTNYFNILKSATYYKIKWALYSMEEFYKPDESEYHILNHVLIRFVLNFVISLKTYTR